MLFSDSYWMPEKAAETSLRERGSRFLAYSFPVTSEAAVKAELEKLRKLYPDATHHCYAYILGAGGEAQRANDDGEPSNSAGRPILRAIMSAGLTNVLVVVVRYFGGTLLGIPGLIQSYGEAARLVLQISGKVEMPIEERFFVETDFQHEQEIHRLVAKMGARILGSDYQEKVVIHVAIKKSLALAWERAVEEHYLLTGSSDIEHI